MNTKIEDTSPNSHIKHLDILTVDPNSQVSELHSKISQTLAIGQSSFHLYESEVRLKKTSPVSSFRPDVILSGNN